MEIKALEICKNLKRTISVMTHRIQLNSISTSGTNRFKTIESDKTKLQNKLKAVMGKHNIKKSQI
jgi:hypothetical protein|tara:strand:+ start:1028 stop:1222 length:195 start_codon:yes stop_codon:yes gene_type:complete